MMIEQCGAASEEEQRVFDMVEENNPSEKPRSKEYVQPLVVASLAAIFGFGYSFYYHGDIARALAVGGVAFLVLFWIVLRGNKPKKQRESAGTPSAVTDDAEAIGTSRVAMRVDWWAGVVVAGSLSLVFAVAIYYTVREEIDCRAKANQLLQAEKDAKVTRVRKIELILWDEVSQPGQALADEIDAVAADLKIPIQSIEKHWPRGPIFVTYEGTAKDAFTIQDAIRWKVGVPTNTYRFVK